MLKAVVTAFIFVALYGLDAYWRDQLHYERAFKLPVGKGNAFRARIKKSDAKGRVPGVFASAKPRGMLARGDLRCC
ncbi:hypothetical protein KC353_g32 [Hortaea werneckii]|nr:hypothetical protein KC353_g32 [Hortaea werneckii]